MAFVFDPTEGGATANSYASVEYADDFLGGELYASAWDDADSGEKQRSLVKATRRLERMFWKGFRTAYTGQALQHPRNGLEDRDGFFYNAHTIIPDVKHATCLLALYYLAQDPAELTDESLRQFKHLRVAGALELEMRDQLPDRDDVPSEVVNLIWPYLTSGPGATRVVRA